LIILKARRCNFA